MFRLNAPVVIRAKVKEVQNNVAIYSHALPRIHVIGGQRSVRIAPHKGTIDHMEALNCQCYSYT